jgi:hypothetical protein
MGAISGAGTTYPSGASVYGITFIGFRRLEAKLFKMSLKIPNR